MPPVHEHIVQAACPYMLRTEPEYLGEKGLECLCRQFGGGHGEVAVPAITSGRDMAGRRHIVGRIGQGNRCLLTPHESLPGGLVTGILAH